MKIIILQDRLRSGGTERQSILLAQAFAAAGHESTLLTFRPGGALADSVSGRVRHNVLQPVDLHLDWFAPGLLPTLRELAPDVVLCMGRMANCYGGAIQRHLPATAVIATMRTGKALPFLFRRSLSVVRHIVANSRDASDTLVRTYGVDRAKIAVIHNSLVFPPPTGVASNQTVRSQFGADANTQVLLCVAMFRPEKNQRELIEIVRDLPADPPWQLWLAGDGPARPACEQWVAKHDLGARVKFPGFQRDPGPLYQAANYAVHASSSEALSNFLIEAQAHGLPVVAYDAQGISECFLPERTGWVIPRGDRDAFRTALTRLMTTSPAGRAKLAQEASAFARQTFDPNRQGAAYLTLFETQLASAPTSL
jgi:glycosyltransferase involved in cell wall biosynthesis